MDFKSALHIMQHSVTEDERRPMKVVIVIESQGSIGGTPCVEVGNLQAGFDWDSGKLMIYPATPLTSLSPEDVEAIRESVSRGQSWHAYQAYKTQKAAQKAVEAQRDELLAAAVQVLEGLNERIDAAIDNRSPTPVFEGIAALHDAINKVTK